MSSMSTLSHTTLGIDLGTTSIKVVCVQSSWTRQDETQQPLYSHSILSFSSADHNAFVSTSSSISSEQSGSVLLLVLQSCLSSIPRDHMEKVEFIGISCQMHGVIMWNDKHIIPFVESLLTNKQQIEHVREEETQSHLITWLDKRCTTDFINTLNATVRRSHHHIEPSPLIAGEYLATGYGIATLAHLAVHNPDILSRYNKAGSIGDYLTWILMNVRSETPTHRTSYPVYMHPTNAAAWGCYDLERAQWQSKRISDLRIPPSLLPTIISAHPLPLFPISSLMSRLLDLPDGCLVTVSVGDAQASVYSIHPTPRQLVMYVGTSAQLSLVVQENDEAEDTEEEAGTSAYTYQANEEYEDGPNFSSSSVSIPSCELRPYFFPSARVLVCASLTGGNGFEWLARALQQLHAQLTDTPSSPHAVNIPLSSEQQRHAEEAAVVHPLSYYYQLCLDQGYAWLTKPPVIEFHPTLFTERHSPTLASILFLSPDPSALNVGSLSSALSLGIVKNLFSMLTRSISSREKRRLQRVTEIIAVGKSMRLNGLLRVYAEREFGRPVILAQGISCKQRNTQEQDNIYFPDAAFGVSIMGLPLLHSGQRQEHRARQG